MASSLYNCIDIGPFTHSAQSRDHIGATREAAWWRGKLFPDATPAFLTPLASVVMAEPVEFGVTMQRFSLRKP